MPKTGRHRSRSDRDLVPIRRSRRQSNWTASVRLERTGRRSDGGARHRRAACDRSGEVAEVGAIGLNRRFGCDHTRQAVQVNRPYLKRLFWFAHIARPSLEAGEFFEERERNLAYRTVTLLRDDQFGLASFFH